MSSIFFISLMSGSTWGGSEELWYRSALLAAMKGNKVGCAVYYWPGKEDRMKALITAGCVIYYFPNKGRSKKNLLERMQNKLSKYRTKKMIRQLPVSSYDMVVVNQGAFEITTPVWKDFYKHLNRYVLLFHNYKEQEVFGPAKAAIIQNWIKGAVANFFASKRIPEVLLKNSGIAISHENILINPISFVPPSSPTPYPPVGKGNYRFVVLAALEVDRKAQDQLILALAAPEWRNRNWSLHLYGEGRDRKLLSELISRQKLQDKVILEGQSNFVHEILEQAHIVLQLTHIDAMPLSVVEAMATARPVVVSRIGDMPFWVREGVNGWISRDATSASIRETMEKAWQHRTEWPDMGKRSFEIFSQKFPDSVEDNFLKQLMSLTKANS